MKYDLEQINRAFWRETIVNACWKQFDETCTYQIVDKSIKEVDSRVCDRIYYPIKVILEEYFDHDN